MAKRFTDTDKWSDDWFLDLPPVMKCCWEYMRDHCDGIGAMKISFRRMSRDIGAEVTREEFDRYFGERIHWLNHENVWVHGFIRAQYKQLSPANRAHMNVARKALRTVAHIEGLGEKATAVVNLLIQLVRQSSDTHAGLGPDPGEARPRDIGNRIQEKEKISSEGGSGGMSAAARQEAHYRFDFLSLWDQYPRVQKKTQSLVLMRQHIRDQETYDQVQTAIRNYREFCRREQIQFAHTLTFPNWWAEWREWLDPKTGVSGTKKKSTLDMLNEREGA